MILHTERLVGLGGAKLAHLLEERDFDLVPGIDTDPQFRKARLACGRYVGRSRRERCEKSWRAILPDHGHGPEQARHRMTRVDERDQDERARAERCG